MASAEHCQSHSRGGNWLTLCRRLWKTRDDLRRGPLETTRSSTLPQFFEFGDKCVWSAWGVAQFSNLLSVAIQDNDGRKSLDLILLGHLFILVSDQIAELFSTRKVQFDQDEIFDRVVRKFRLREHLPLQLDAPATPI